MTSVPETNLAVFTTVPHDHALAYLRYRAAAEALGWNIIYGKEGENTVHPQRVAEADFVLIQRDFPRFFGDYLQVVQEARRKGIPILYDLDDAIMALPEDHPLLGDYSGCLENILFALLDADRLIVSSEMLADVVQPLNENVVVWHSILPDSLWKIKPPSATRNEPTVKIGYMGGSTHTSDLALLFPVLASLQQEYGESLEFVLWGDLPSENLLTIKSAHYHAEVQAYPAFAEAFPQAEVDIWLAPLQDNLFNRCKSSIKFWEYSAIGGVGVFSRLPPYETVIRHGENGFLADTPEEWLQFIRFLIQNPERRYQMAQQAQQTLLEEGLLSRHIQQWEQVFRTAHSKSPGRNTPFQQAFRRLASQIQMRSDEKEHRIAQLIEEHRRVESQYALLNQEHQRLKDRHSRLHEYLRALESRSMQLDEIFHSRSWRLLQWMNKLRRFDFSPIQYPPPPSPPDAEQESRPGTSPQDD